MSQKTVSLVLGSGGARGAAHIGVIRCLEDHGYKIETIAGASVGALVGGFYAAGRLDPLQQWLCALERHDVLQLLDLSFTGGGLFKGDKLMNALGGLVKDRTIETLPIDLTVVAVDIDRQKEIWLTDGSLFEAIRGSIAIPSVFKPHRYRDMLLVDGGVLNPVPVSAAMQKVTDLTLAVNLNGRRLEHAPAFQPQNSLQARESIDKIARPGVHNAIMRFIDRWRAEDTPKARIEEEFSTLELLNRSIETMQNTIAYMKLSANIPDVVVDVPFDCGGLFDYHLADTIIERGYNLCLDALTRYESAGFEQMVAPLTEGSLTLDRLNHESD